ncbi:hypothetical protein MGSAQ_001798, partial [marine sediment metagenome]
PKFMIPKLAAKDGALPIKRVTLAVKFSYRTVLAYFKCEFMLTVG